MKNFCFSLLVLSALTISAPRAYAAPSELRVDNNYESRYCEFYVDTFYIEHTSHYGVPEDKMVSTINVLKHDGKLLRVGQWIQYTTADEKELQEVYSYGDYDRSVEFQRVFVDPASRKTIRRNINQFAYFVDILRPNGEIARLWQSDSSRNFMIEEIMAYPTYSVVIPYGKKEYANENNRLFIAKHNCKF